MTRARALFLLAALSPGVGSAQETTSGSHDSLAIRSRVGVETEAARFERDGTRGSFLTVAPIAELSTTGTWSVRARVPFHDVFLPDGARAGLGDVDLRFRLRVFSNAPPLVTAGLTVTAPTGDSRRALGGGDLQLAPFVSVGWEIKPVIFYLTVADQIAKRVRSDAIESYVDPSTQHELRYEPGVIYKPSSFLFATFAGNFVTILEAPDRGTTLVAVTPQLGVSPADGLRVTAGVQIPVAGPRRFEEKALLSVQLYFLREPPLRRCAGARAAS